MATVMHTLHVELGERSYPIYIGRELLWDADLLRRKVTGSQAVIVTNDTVAPLYSQRLLDTLGDLERVTEIVLPDGEQYKTLQTVSRIYDRLLQEGHDRSTTLIALGGGVVGDITGFAAASYQRGVKFVQVPTTLLAQVDSSVGGKTGVNHPLGKNMIGAFHQPDAVFIDIDTLHTLPTRELAAGLAEVIKYGLICDPPFYRWLHDHIAQLLALEEGPLAEAIERSCSNKARIVAQDEREGGVRALLNFGHTFGHAVETAQGYGNWLHGEAVAAGMMTAMRLSVAHLGLDASELPLLEELLTHAGLPVKMPPGASAEEYLALMQRDKKVVEGRLRLILLQAIGEAVVRDDVSRETLLDLLDSAC